MEDRRRAGAAGLREDTRWSELEGPPQGSDSPLPNSTFQALNTPKTLDSGRSATSKIGNKQRQVQMKTIGRYKKKNPGLLYLENGCLRLGDEGTVGPHRHHVIGLLNAWRALASVAWLIEYHPSSFEKLVNFHANALLKNLGPP